MIRAWALDGEPVVLLLDAPISALDIRHQLEVLATAGRLTRERNLVTICILHDRDPRRASPIAWR